MTIQVHQTQDSPGDYKKNPTEQQQRWGREISAFQTRTRKFTKRGNKTVRRFLDQEGSRDHEGTSTGWQNIWFRLNLFNSNIVTLQAMLFGSTPKTDVSRRFSDPDDDVARVSAVMLQRILETSIEEPGADFSEVIKGCLEDRLLPGLGVARVRYEFDSETNEIEALLDDDGEELIEAYEDEVVSNESSPIDYVHWRDFAWGWGRTWKEIPWIAFRSHLTHDKMEKRFGKRMANSVNYIRQNPTGSKEHDEPFDRNQQDPWATASVWEIWEKDARKVHWFSSGAQKLLDTKEDPLGLPGFYPCPKPMAANLTTTQFLPKSDYAIAQDLYGEIDVLSTRIAVITQAVKVVGVYDKNSEGVKRMLKEGVENDLIPVDNFAMFAEKGGIAGTVDWLPIQEIAGVLDKLRELRAETIQLLHEQTGMSDIMRGSSEKYTAASTDKLKAKFASIRVQAIQDEFARFASDLMTLKACVISVHYQPESIAEQANMQASPDQELVGPALELIKQKTKWAYRVEIKPESIAMVDYAELKQDRTEYLTAMSTFLQSAQSVIKAEPGAGTFLLELMKWGLAGFKGSKEIEGVVDKAVAAIKQSQEQAAQQPPQPSPEEIKAKADAAAAQQKSQAAQQQEQLEHQNTMQQLAADHQNDMQQLTTTFHTAIKEMEAQLMSTIRQEQAQAESKILEGDAQHDNKMEEIEATGEEARHTAIVNRAGKNGG